MSSDQWQQVKEAFDHIADLPDLERHKALAQITDAIVSAEVARLVDLHHRGSPLLDQLCPNVEMPRLPTGLHALVSGQLAAGRFRVLRFIAAGGMGEVYEARDEHLNENVALKVVRQDAALREATLARFKKELQLARRVSHPNVCRVHDIWQYTTAEGLDADFFTMELLEGETLSAFLSREGKFSPDSALDLIRQIVDGIEAAHLAGVVHRDLKPGNIMLVPASDGKVRAVITDFGLSQNDAAHAKSTQASAAAGTPAYMAPEQIEGKRAGPEADIYALGVVMFEMLAGRLPFDGPSPMALAVQKSRDTARPPSSFLPGLDKIWDSVILRCLALNPQDRFATVRDVWRALHGETISRRQKPWAWHRSRRVAIAAVGGAAAIAALLAWGLFARYTVNPEALRRYNEGVSAFRDGGAFRANKLFELATRLDSGYAPAYAKLAETWIDLDYSDRANEALVRATEQRQLHRWSTDELLTIDAAQAAVLRDRALASKRYKQIAVASNESGAWFDLGRSQERNEQAAEARISYQKALTLNADNAAAHMRLGILDGRSQKIDAALKHLEQAEKSYKATSDYEGEAEVLLTRGGILIHNNRGSEGEPFIRLAYERARANGNLPQQVQALTHLSSASIFAGKIAEARERMEEPLRLASENGMESIAVTALVDLGNTFFAQYQLKEAEEYFMRALETAKRFKLPGKQAMASLSLASLATRRSQPDVVLAYARPAVEFYRSAGYRRNRAQGQSIICQALIAQGKLDEASRLVSMELDDKTGSEDVNQTAIWLETRADIASRQGNLPQALTDYREARKDRQKAGRKQEEMYAALNEADHLSQLGKMAEAEQLLQQVQPALAKLDPGLQARWFIVASRNALRGGDRKSAAEKARSGLLVAGGKSDTRLRIFKAILCAAGSQPGAQAAECREVQMMVQQSGKKLAAEVELLVAEGLLAAGDAKRARAAFTGIDQEVAEVNPELRYRALRRSGQSSAALEPVLQKLFGVEGFVVYKRRADLAQISK